METQRTLDALSDSHIAVSNMLLKSCFNLFMNLIILTVLVKIDASDIVTINHVLHAYAERVSNAARHHSMRLCWYTTSWVHDAVMYICKVYHIRLCEHFV